MKKEQLEDKMMAALKGSPWNCPAKDGHIKLAGRICPECRAFIPLIFGPREWANNFGPPISQEVLDPEQDLKDEYEQLRQRYERENAEFIGHINDRENAKERGDLRKMHEARERSEQDRLVMRRTQLSMDHVGQKIAARRAGRPEPQRPGWIDRVVEGAES